MALPVRYPAFLISAQFATGVAYLWTGMGNLTWNGQTWSGVGALGGVSTIRETATVSAEGITLYLSGIDSGVLADVLQEIRVGKPAQVYLAFFDSTGTLIPDPILIWAGDVDQPSIVVSGEYATIALRCESPLFRMNVPVDRRYTQDDQQILASGDQAFQFVPSIQEMNIYWGTTPYSANNL